MQILRAATRRRRRGERGAVAVEAALVLPMIILLIFGMIEFSLMLRDYVSITAATRAGIRVASTGAGAGPGGCDNTVGAPPCTPPRSPALAQSAADAVQNALTGVPPDSINYMLIYEANSKGYPCVSAASCPAETSSTMPTSCNGYANCVKFTWQPTAGADGLGAFRYNAGAWESASINACINTADSLGIYLNATHKWLTGLFGTSMDLADRSVASFEPLPTDTCKPGQISAHP